MFKKIVAYESLKKEADTFKQDYDKLKREFYSNPKNWDNNKRKLHGLPLRRGRKKKQTFASFYNIYKYKLFDSVCNTIDEYCTESIIKERFENFVNVEDFALGDKNAGFNVFNDKFVC